MKTEDAAPRRARGGGRPPKFREPRRPVTVTLPERTLARLTEIDADRARAIVRAADNHHGSKAGPDKPVEILPVGPRLGVIVLARCPMLSRISRLRTIEIAPSRFLLAIEPGTPIERVALEITDLIDGSDPSNASDRALLVELLAALRTRIRASTMEKAEIMFVEPATDEDAR